ncbi:MAG: Clp protease ClpP [Bilophila sp.]|uniref:head maturation protease, ClpP-related n=1 Tax=Bilophila sp. TaxID=1929485 RepID=UPI00257D516A|nr:head maturation protease, ClpP-related [Bilophila sp.]MBS5456679.1 Clp protease ClpP [Bilophila sp.]
MDRLLKLLRDNARNRVADIPKAQVEASGETTLYLYDVIVSDDYWGGISAEKFVKELNALDVPTIHLRINSPGGEVFAARAIEAAIRNHPARIVAHVDGYAASAASFVAVACDEVEIAPGGFFMIHKAWTFTAGNADDLLHTAEMLEKLDASLVDTYAKKSGCTPEDIAGWMKAETWFSARESVERGFADRVAEAAPKAQADWNLSVYANAPVVPAAAASINPQNRERYERTARLFAVTRH